ncbi:MAG: small ribosomal subunit biogenesis GTPase RsgA [Porticoccaceae bacterium]|nr:small ribosomal subunit biogenesis GTPase RsgA [Porticoccaceae bacterium]
MSKRKLSNLQKSRIRAVQEQRMERAKDGNSITIHEIDNADDLGPEISGTVVSNFGTQVDIEANDGDLNGKIIRCHMRSNLDPLVTGDKVIWRFAEPYGVVVARIDRYSELIRPDAYGKLRPVAANVDVIAIVFSPKPTAFSNLIDRYLVAAEAQNIQPVLILNKTDLDTENEFSSINQLVHDYKSIGYDVLSVSAKTADGFESLKDYLCNKTAIFVGQSGVGKSSLINRLQPQANVAVGSLSIGKEKGTHTTTVSRLFHFAHGGILIDSPGIREFSLTHLTQEQVINSFIDFRPYLGRCKFRDCLHKSEPGCSLIDAVSQKKILQSRFDNYHQIIMSQESERR